MSSLFLQSFSRHGRRRLRFGWMATSVMVAGPRVIVRAASYNTQVENPFEAIKELANRIKQADRVRVPRVESNGASSKIEETKLRRELANEICASYKSLLPLKLPLSESCDRTRILMFLSKECSPTNESVFSEVDHFVAKKDSPEKSLSARLQALAVSNLRKASTPAYEEVLEYILKQDARNGMQFLVTLREDILRALEWIRLHSKDDERFQHLEDLDAYLLRLFSLWFSPGMLGEYEPSCVRLVQIAGD